MADKGWIQELKAGDEVAVQTRRYYPYRLLSVDKVTETLIRIGNHSYSRKDGYLRGSGSWDGHFLEQVTPEIRATIHRDNLLSYVKAIKMNEATTEQLEAVYAIFKGSDNP